MNDRMEIVVRDGDQLGEGDPLQWLYGKEKGIRERIASGEEFVAASIRFEDGKELEIAFIGDTYNDFAEASGHTIFIDDPSLLNRVQGLEYDKEKKAWMLLPGDDEYMFDGVNIVYLYTRDGKEYFLGDGREYESEDKEAEAPGFNKDIDTDMAIRMFNRLLLEQKKAGLVVKEFRQQ